MARILETNLDVLFLVDTLFYFFRVGVLFKSNFYVIKVFSTSLENLNVKKSVLTVSSCFFYLSYLRERTGAWEKNDKFKKLFLFTLTPGKLTFGC